jgi:hypothetical protein
MDFLDANSMATFSDRDALTGCTGPKGRSHIALTDGGSTSTIPPNCHRGPDPWRLSGLFVVGALDSQSIDRGGRASQMELATRRVRFRPPFDDGLR